MQNVDNLQLLMQHAKNMYRIGIQKFPTNSYLRITYAFFLIEKMNKKQEAIAELNAASMLNPPFDE
jgi:predicted Zn-dependent protease